ncbi:CorA soluble [Glarea lozoyensis ATCC 20868]|uniref:CorA soluble n=2 Tax=Glarea lozoyensis TaxID=101852 RepID=S3DU33_GLAL2|nr:CorA soluble [Glarea lozoyensis ATCC 20868]EHL03877.1 putative metal ion transporter C27B12.12c [Glarea lozoyensis 74030]EPE29913.1 CorA soluble [Glarea lozoyensis ATCC 20868]
MSDHEDTFSNTGYSTPVPELDDHTHQTASVQKQRSRRGTVDTIHSFNPRGSTNPDLGLVNQGLLHTTPRDFEHAVIDEEHSPSNGRRGSNVRSRRGTVTTIDPRSTSPPNSVKAFADARRRERELSTNDPISPKGLVEPRRLDECDLRRTTSAASRPSLHSRRYTNDNDSKSLAESIKSEAEEDVCFPLHNTGNKNTLQIDFEELEAFIAEEEDREKTPPKGQPQARVFNDLRPQKAGQMNIPTIITSDGDFIETGTQDSSIMDEKVRDESMEELPSDTQTGTDINRFEFFSSEGEATIHAAEFGDLIMPGEDVRTLFSLPEGGEEDGVWWLNMNNPTEEEIRAICKAFGVHPLTIEDIGTQEAREKIELFPSYYFACFRSFHVEQIEGGQEYEPFNIYVVVFREGTLSFSFSPNPHAAHVRKRITMLKDYVALSSDWICYALIDDIVDSFAPIITKIEHETDAIEDEVFVARNDDMHSFLRRIGMVRKNVMGLMKLLGGKADVLRGFTKRCNANYKVTPRMDIGLYLGDIQDHVVTMMTNLAHFEKMLSRSHSNYLAQLSIDNITQGNHANRVLSKITLLASILVPLNLVCGLFGMNVHVPWGGGDNLGPFFGIFGFLIFFTILSLFLARRMRYI